MVSAQRRTAFYSIPPPPPLLLLLLLLFFYRRSTRPEREVGYNILRTIARWACSGARDGCSSGDGVVWNRGGHWRAVTSRTPRWLISDTPTTVIGDRKGSSTSLPSLRALSLSLTENVVRSLLRDRGDVFFSFFFFCLIFFLNNYRPRRI